MNRTHQSWNIFQFNSRRADYDENVQRELICSILVIWIIIQCRRSGRLVLSECHRREEIERRALESFPSNEAPADLHTRYDCEQAFLVAWQPVGTRNASFIKKFSNNQML